MQNDRTMSDYELLRARRGSRNPERPRRHARIVCLDCIAGTFDCPACSRLIECGLLGIVGEGRKKQAMLVETGFRERGGHGVGGETHGRRRHALPLCNFDNPLTELGHYNLLGITERSPAPGFGIIQHSASLFHNQGLRLSSTNKVVVQNVAFYWPPRSLVLNAVFGEMSSWMIDVPALQVEFGKSRRISGPSWSTTR